MKKILIVEDEIPTIEALETVLVENGYEVSKAIDGVEGLKVALKTHPELILLDLIMPKMDGMAMLKELRKDGWGAKAKVVLLTNLSDATKMEEAAEQDVQDYLVKADWKLSDVVKVIEARLNES